MPGTIALLGGSPFAGDDRLDKRLVDAAGADSVVVLPTADAFETPGALVAAAELWGERIGASIWGPLAGN